MIFDQVFVVLSDIAIFKGEKTMNASPLYSELEENISRLSVDDQQTKISILN